MIGGEGWKALRLEEVETCSWSDTELSWHPLREALETRIAGMAAFSAEHPGQELVEAHDEHGDGREHEEVYVVLQGRARFTVAGKSFDAPAGTFVRVDPGVHRQAVAAEPPTTVLAIGGPPTFEPSASEWIERARPYIRSDPARAWAIVEELREVKPSSAGVAVAEALLAVGLEDEQLARRRLAEVLGNHPELSAPLSKDPDLAPVLAAASGVRQPPMSSDTPNANPEKDPDDWVTGDEPMTGPQASYLRTLCQEAGEDFDENLNKAQASERIEELQGRTGRGKG